MVDIIWDWVGEAKRALRDSGRSRLAELMDQISSYTCDEKHAQVDAIYPEAVALAREAGNPWIEVFIRHWNLQSRILRRHQVGEWMAEAVSLIEFANRPETRDCPQSICTTQDLVNCYGNIDGPGYAEERIQATRETLARIDAGWPCYQCIAGELISALNDAGRVDEAMETIEQIDLEVRQARRIRTPYPMVESRVHTLRLMGRLDEALAVNEEGRKHVNDEGDVRKRAQERALLLALRGELEEAQKASPGFDVVRGTHSSYIDWAETQRILAEKGAVPNDWQLDAYLRILGDDLLTNGVLRDAFQVFVWRCELACLRGRAGVAERVYAQAEAIVPRLRVPLDAPAILASLNGRMAAVPAQEVSLGDDADAYLETVGFDPELDAIGLAQARARWPEHRAIMLALVSALRTTDQFGEAQAIFETWLATHPDDVDAINLLGATYLDAGDLDGATAAYERMQACDHPDQPVMSHWFAYRLATQRGDDDEAVEHLCQVVSLQPSASNATQALVSHLVARGDLDEALGHLDRICGLRDDVGGYDWERMVVATCLGRWEAVRSSAARIGWTLEGEGPIDEAWELVMIQFQTSDGDDYDLFAQRTGPVTAKILSMTLVGDRSHYLDQVVFRATPLNAPPEEEDEDHTWVYPVMRVLQSAGYSVYTIYGVHPGAEAADALWQRLVDQGCDVSVLSDESYELWREDQEASDLGLYTLMAVPPEADIATLAAQFSEATADYVHPLVCPGLWTALGESDESAEQRARLEPWGF